MQRLILILLFFLPVLACHAGEVVTGRWEGTVQIPGDEFAVIVDLAEDGSGAWTGSMIVPGLNIKGAPLADIAVRDSDITFAVNKALEDQQGGHAKFTARLDSRDTMSGQFLQAGNAAAFALKKTGAAQVELPLRSTAVAKALEGKWIGEYEFGGYPRHVTLTLANHARAAATAEFVIVGKKTTTLPVDLITQEEDFLRIEASQIGINFEGRFSKTAGDIKGTFEQGPVELPLVLHRGE